MTEVLGFQGAHLELELVDDAAMARLNHAYLGCHGPTNVLSFPYSPEETAPMGPEDMPNLGQLVLAPQTVCREVFLYGQDLRRHTLWLLAHGVAHLGGHDHGPVMDAVAEEALLAAQEGLSLHS